MLEPLKNSPDNNSPDNVIRLESTDELLPRHWVAGSQKYVDFAPLAEGGTAALQTCFDKNLRRTVVYKSLHPHLRASEVETKRFLREARVTGLIAHPGTVPLYELGRSMDGSLYFTMKLLCGRDLRSVINDLVVGDAATQREFTLNRLVDILISACQTLAYAHSLGVIHRDIKPANILVGAFAEVTVLDWGLAKVYGELDSSADEIAEGKRALALELTQPGKRYGTPLYMSPEQAKADPDLDERSDVYNLGSVLFEMLTHKNLVWGNDVDEVLEQILEQPAPVPSEASPELDIPKELESICLKALAKHPDERYQNVQAFAADLSRWRDNEEVSVYSYTGLQRLKRWRTRNQLLVAALISLVLGSLLTWLYTVVAVGL